MKQYKVNIYKLQRKTRAILRGEGGTTLLEAIVAIFVFSAMMVTIAMIIMCCLRMTEASTKMAGSMKDEANAALMGGGPHTGIEVESTPGTTVGFVFGDHGYDRIDVTVTVQKSRPESDPGDWDFAAFGPGQ